MTEEIDLIRRGRSGDWYALADLSESYRGRIAAIAVRHAMPNRSAQLLNLVYEPALSRADLESEGKIALVKAVGSFDEKRGVKFSTYVHSQVEGAMKRAVRRWRPKLTVRNCHGYEMLTVQNIELSEAGRVSETERAEEAQVPGGMPHEPDVASLRTHRHRHREELSLRTPSSCAEARERLRGRPPPNVQRLGVCKAWERRRKPSDLVSALTVLTKRERDFLNLWRHMDYSDKTQKTVAAAMGIKDSRASKIKTSLLTKLEKELGAVLVRPPRVPQPLERLPPDLPPRIPLGSMWHWQFASKQELLEALHSYHWGEDRQCLRISARPAYGGRPPSSDALFSLDRTFRVFRQNTEIDHIWTEIDAARKAGAHR